MNRCEIRMTNDRETRSVIDADDPSGLGVQFGFLVLFQFPFDIRFR
jgi:hypothetical protein